MPDISIYSNTRIRKCLHTDSVAEAINNKCFVLWRCRTKMLLFLADLPLNDSAYTTAPRAYHYALFVRSVYDCYVPILIVGGLLCNIVSIVVLANNSVGGGGGEEGDGTSSPSLYAEDSYDTYLSSRAVADSVFLLCLLVVWLETVDILMYSTAGWCQVRWRGWSYKRT